LIAFNTETPALGTTSFFEVVPEVVLSRGAFARESLVLPVPTAPHRSNGGESGPYTGITTDLDTATEVN
jgi:hypothetical protein